MPIRSLVRTIWLAESIGAGQPTDSASFFPQRGQADSRKAIIQVEINQDPVGDDLLILQGRVSPDASFSTIATFDLATIGAAANFTFGVNELLVLFPEMRMSSTVVTAWNITAGTTASVWLME